MALFRNKKQHQASPRRRNVGGSDTPASSAQSSNPFRRNRTLTGSLVSHIASAGEHQSMLRSPRVQAHDLRAHRRKLVVYLLSCVGVVTLLGFLVYQSIAIPKVVATTTTSFDADRYERQIQEYLNGRPFERFRFMLNTKNLSDYLQVNGSPEVSSVSPDMTFAGLGASTIKLAFRAPVVVWQSGTESLYVDGSGVAFARNYMDGPGVSVLDTSGLQANGSRVLASDTFLAFIGQLVSAMERYQYAVTQVVIPPGTTRQVQVVVVGVSYPVKFSVDRPVGEQAEDAARAIRYLAAQGIGATYLDVRVSGRAFYK